MVLLPCSVAYLCVPADYDGGHDSDNLEVDNVDSSAPGDVFVCGIERERGRETAEVVFAGCMESCDSRM